MVYKYIKETNVRQIRASEYINLKLAIWRKGKSQIDNDDDEMNALLGDLDNEADGKTFELQKNGNLS